MRLDLGAAFQRFSEENLVAVLAGEGDRVVLANDAFLEMVGYSRAELDAGSVDWAALTPGEWLDQDAVGQEQLRRTGTAGPLFKEYRHRDGHRVPVHLSAVLLDEDPFQWCSIVVDLTAQRAAEHASERTAAMLSALVREAPIGIAFLDPELRFLHVNDALAQMNGVAPQDHVGRTVAELVPGVAEQALPLLRRVLETGEPLVDIEVGGETAARPGVRRDWLETFYRVDTADEAVGVGVVATEVTDRRRAERRLRKLIDGLFTFVGLCAPDGTLIEANRTALDAAGLHAGDVLGEPFWETYWWSHDPTSQQRLREAIQRCAAGEASRYDAEVRLHGDRRITIDFQLVPLIEQGDVTALIPSGVDITDRMAGVHQLEDTAALARRLSASTSSAEAIEAVLALAPSALGADLVNVGLCDDQGDHLVVAHPAGLAVDRAAADETIALDTATPLTDAVTRRELRILSGAGDHGGRYEEFHREVVAAGLTDVAAVPLLDRTASAFGALGVGWAGPAESPGTQQARLVTVAELCAQTLLRTRVADDQRDFVSALQDELLPAVPEVPGLDVAVRYRPSSTQIGFGGDWYDVIPLGGARSAYVVGDVAGHGIEAAAQMAQVRGAINAVLEIGVGLGELFATAAAPLARLGEPFLGTAVVALVDLGAGTVEVVSAGHPPPALRRPDGSVALLAGGRVRALGRPCGPAQPAVADFAPGSTLVLYTDGLVERPGEVVDEGVRRLTDALGAVEPRCDSQRAVDALVEHLLGDDQLRDDMAAVAISRA